MTRAIPTILLLFALLPVPVAAAGADQAGVRLSGMHRTRVDHLDNQFRAGLGGSDQAVLLHSQLRVDVGGPRLGAVLEVVDARGYRVDQDGSTSAGAVNVLEPVQAHVRLGWGGEGSDPATTLQLGRFTMDLGSRRLVGRQRFGNTLNGFTGARVDTGFAGGTLTGFWTWAQQRKPTAQEDVFDNQFALDDEGSELGFRGLFLTTPAWGEGLTTELYAYDLAETDAGGRRATRNRDLFTLGGRLLHSAGNRDWELEAAWQTGEARASSAAADTRNQDVNAWMLHAEHGWRFPERAGLRVALELDVASGDESPTDDNSERFDPLFGPVRFDFGPTSLYTHLHRSNIVSPGVRLDLQPRSDVAVLLHWQGAWLAEDRDSFARTGVRDSSGNSGDFAGHQLEVRLQWRARTWLQVEFGGARFWNGEFMDDAPNATGEGDPLYGYGSLTFTF